MSLLYTGYKRSLVVEIYKNGVLTDDSPYNGQLPFHAPAGQIYDLLTDDQFKILSSEDYLQRLQDFQLYVSSLEAGISFTLDVPGTYASRIAGSNCTTTTTTTTSTTTSTTTTTTSTTTTTTTTSTTSTSTTTTTTTENLIPPPMMKVAMNIDSAIPDDYAITQINFKGDNLLSETILGGTTVTQLPMLPANIGTGTLTVSATGDVPSESGSIVVIDSNFVTTTLAYTGAGDYVFNNPTFVINNIQRIFVNFFIDNPTTTTTTTSTTSTSTTTQQVLQ